MAKETRAEKQARERKAANTRRAAVRRAEKSIDRSLSKAQLPQPSRSAKGKIKNKNSPSTMAAQATRTPADRAMERQVALRQKIAAEAKGAVSTSPAPSKVKKLTRNVPKTEQKTSSAAARKAGHLYYYKDGKKMAAVTGDMLKKSGFKTLRAFMNYQENKTARV